MATWRILDRGDVPLSGARVNLVPFECQCGAEADLPVLGRVLAISGGHDHSGDEAFIFDTDGPWASPKEIQCRKCRRRLVHSRVAEDV